MVGLGEAEVVSVEVLKEFDSYQSPALEGLNSATDSYLAGEEDVVDLTLELIDPMLRRMVELTEENKDE